jgi:hypothetical protein
MEARDFEEARKISRCQKMNYRNPLMGEFPEKEINPFTLKKLLKRVVFDVSFVPHFCSESLKCLKIVVKRFYYWVEKYLPIAHLYLILGVCTLRGKEKAWLNRTNKIC